MVVNGKLLSYKWQKEMARLRFGPELHISLGVHARRQNENPAACFDVQLVVFVSIEPHRGAINQGMFNEGRNSPKVCCNSHYTTVSVMVELRGLFRYKDRSMR